MMKCFKGLAVSDNWEPIELRTLKQQLANFKCKCMVCESSKNHSKSGTEISDGEVQCELVEIIDFPFRELPATSHEINHYFCNSLCANCFIPRHIIKGEIIRVMKDEQSETTPENKCDVCIGDVVTVATKSTSFTNKLNPKYANLKLRDVVSVCSICSAELESKRKSQLKVKFANYDQEEIEAQNISLYDDCLSAEKIIDSIRPPLYNS